MQFLSGLLQMFVGIGACGIIAYHKQTGALSAHLAFDDILIGAGIVFTIWGFCRMVYSK